LSFAGERRRIVNDGSIVQAVMWSPVSRESHPHVSRVRDIRIRSMKAGRGSVVEADLLDGGKRLRRRGEFRIHLPTTFGILLVQPRIGVRLPSIVGHLLHNTDEIISDPTKISDRSWLNNPISERSRHMSTTPQKQNTLSSLPNNHKPVEPAKAPEPTLAAAVETPKAEAVDAKTIVSISVEPKLARQARLLAKIKGVSISSLFTDAATLAIPAALKTALAEMKDEVE
jgi:hypothetical protein